MRGASRILGLVVGLTLAGCASARTSTTISGTGFSSNRVSLDVPLKVDAKLTVGEATYGDVLRRMGPPAAIGDFPDSGEFAFLYDHIEAYEWLIKLSYQNVQGTYARGTGKHQTMLIVFEPNGVLLSCTPVDRKLYLGWGLTVGSSLTPHLFFGFRDYLAKDTTLQRWGADLLDPRGKRVVIGSGQGFLYAPTQTTSFGQD